MPADMGTVRGYKGAPEGEHAGTHLFGLRNPCLGLPNRVQQPAVPEKHRHSQRVRLATDLHRAPAP